MFQNSTHANQRVDLLKKGEREKRKEKKKVRKKKKKIEREKEGNRFNIRK